MKTIKITKCLFPIIEGEWANIPQPVLGGMRCITTSIVGINKSRYEQYEFIPFHVNLCEGGNAKRVGDEIHMKEERINPLNDPANHSLDVLLKEIQRGRPAAAQQLIQGWIDSITK